MEKLRAARLTRVQQSYLREAERRHLEYGWGGYRSTQTVRLLEQWGLITVSWGHGVSGRWLINGLTSKGRAAAARLAEEASSATAPVAPGTRSPRW